MENLLVCAVKALNSLFAPGMFVVFFQSIALAIAVLFAFVAGAGYFFWWLQHAMGIGLPWWLGDMASAVVAFMFFPGIMPVIVSFFDYKIASLIERQDYPGTTPVVQAAFWPDFWHDVRFSLWAAVLNIIVLPLYLIPGLNLVLFYVLNGYLLGREFFGMMARRHVSLEASRTLYRSHNTLVISAGILLTLLATIPVINLIAPFWGMAMMVHLYHKVKLPDPVVSYRQIL